VKSNKKLKERKINIKIINKFLKIFTQKIYQKRKLISIFFNTEHGFLIFLNIVNLINFEN